MKYHQQINQFVCKGVLTVTHKQKKMYKTEIYTIKFFINRGINYRASFPCLCFSLQRRLKKDQSLKIVLTCSHNNKPTRTKDF